MDPVAHTLVGASLAESGLKKYTPLGTATLLIAANLPDVDILSLAWGEPFGLSFRRGWTHGILAVLVLPFVLTGIMMFWDRYVRRARAPDKLPAIPRQLLMLATIGVLTHPMLDFLNVYGIRLLMPFSDRWFYGDTLFIVDLWFWAILAGGLWLARRRRIGGSTDRRTDAESTGRWVARPARMALLVLGAYIVAMAGSTLAARWMVWRSMPFSRAGVNRIMVAPQPLNPLRRYVVTDEGEEYRVGEFNWLGSPKIRYGDLAVLSRRGGLEPAALSTVDGKRFLYWARFPFFEAVPGSAGRLVDIIDARYALDAEAVFGALTVEVEANDQ
jgi:inner membrane protein